MFLTSGPSNLISNGGIDARCNKDAIIIYCTLVQFHRNASYLVILSCFIYNMMLNKRCSGVNLDSGSKMWWTLHDQWWWGRQTVPILQTQFFRLSKIEIHQGFEQTWCGRHGCQDISHTYVRVHRLPTTLLQLHWCEELPSVDTCNCGLDCNLTFGINLIKELLIATWGAWVKTRCNKLHK